MDPVVVAVAPNGARKTKSDHPGLPLSPDELAQCAAECLDAGAAMLHLHVRDAAGRHSLAPDDYRAAIDTIRARVGRELLLQVTTESGGRYGPAEQIACMEALAPEALSVAIRELFGAPGSEEPSARFLGRLAARGALVQYIVYSAADVRNAVDLQGRGVIPQRQPHVLAVLGSYADSRAGRPAELLPLLAMLPEAWRWSACAFGREELQCVIAAALLGGGARVGFENNLNIAAGAVAPDNAALVRGVREALAAVGRRPATCVEARGWFAEPPT
jgi:3-keto-5-aminohexanoate cleavage enzyme